ncbi:MAG: hypothetical protein KAQ90_08810, partial [Melioribacteraceae bacterium]|nr:hypothetical protein [Melioribacteraceae bacterium]
MKRLINLSVIINPAINHGVKRKPKKFLTVLTVLLLHLLTSFSFPQSIFDYNGYLQNMQTVWVQKEINIWALSGSVINRFNFHLYPSNEFTFNLSLRNILDYGQTV